MTRPIKNRRVNERPITLCPPPTRSPTLGTAELVEAIDSITPTAFSQAMRSVLVGHETMNFNSLPATQTRLQPSLDFWLETGDIVLGVESLIFRVHKSVLAENSSVFSDMLQLGTPAAAEQVEGVPYVELQDSAGDWIELLKWMYTGLPNYDTDSVVIPFSTLKAHLSLSNKYEITTLQEHLQLRFKPQLSMPQKP
ncbi:hypothetical protein FRC17_004091 [Serendipita sp. 399]|nr:hypothetical protein FRC17_004091 [Serendipita sp. 399]